jgi:hypothetical protein
MTTLTNLRRLAVKAPSVQEMVAAGLADEMCDPFEFAASVPVTFQRIAHTQEPCPKCDVPLWSHYEQEMQADHLCCHECGYEGYDGVGKEGMH